MLCAITAATRGVIALIISRGGDTSMMIKRNQVPEVGREGDGELASEDGVAPAGRSAAAMTMMSRHENLWIVAPCLLTILCFF